MIEFLQPLLPSLDLPIIAVCLLLVFVVLGFFREWAAPEVVALSALGAILILGLLPLTDVFDRQIVDGEIVRTLTDRGLLSVFANGAPITIACMFVLSAGLERTGTIEVMGRFFTRIAGKSELRVMLTLMLMAAVLSAFVNNTPIVVVFLPIVLSHAKATGLKASRLLIPLSFASILGGTCTLTGTSTNLIIDGIAQDYGQQPFTMFEVSKLGLVYAVIGFVYLIFIGRKLLPERSSLAELIEPAEVRSFLTQFSVEKDSPLIDKSLVETLLKEIPSAQILEVRRRGKTLDVPLNQLTVKQGDRLLLTLHGTSFKDLHETDGIRFAEQKNLNLKELETRELQLIEGIVGPRSSFVGKTLKQIGFRRAHRIHVLAIHRQGKNINKDFDTVKLQFGDTLLMEGPTEAINRIQKSNDFVTITDPPEITIRPAKLWTGVAITAAFVIGAALSQMDGMLPIPAVAIVAAIAMILTNCLSPQQAYEAIQWNILFLIFGMLALGLAMDQSGAAALMVNGIMNVVGDYSPVVILSVIYLLSSILTELISNNAVAALLTPVIIGIAATLDVDARPFIVALMFGCSASFATPIGYQTNTYVYGAGGYKFNDFPKVGVPLNLILWVAATILIPWLWPFTS
ncbi:MAG: SLC13 family permease [Verrucomicrobia bacterium]|nr:SLC13 family permease [Verrucomicrobiota bacterium]